MYGLHYRTWPCIGAMTYTCLELAVKYDQMAFCCVCDWFLAMTVETLLEKEMATHSSILVWRFPWTEEPGRLQAMGGCTESETTERLTYNIYRETKNGRSKRKPWAHQYANVYG